MTELRAASLDELNPGQPKLVEVGGIRVVLARVGDQIHAVADACAHRGGPLSDGKLSGFRLACPWHGWMYDVRSGHCTFPDRGASVASYRTRVEAGEVWVELS